MSKMDYLKEKPIAILGMGSVGKACAADCALAGAKVNVCDLEPFSETTLFGIEKQGVEIYGRQLNLYGFDRLGKGKMNLVTTDIAKAVKGAGLILITIPAVGHESFFSKLIPALEDGQVIHIIPDNFGTLVLKKMMREAGCDKKVIVGGWSSAPYGCRVDIEGGVHMPRVYLQYRAITLRGASLPSIDQEDFLESTKYLGCFDSINEGSGPVGGNTVIDIGFSNVNPVLHVPGTLLGVGTMENWGKIYGTFDKKDFSIYSHAFCPSISQVQYTFYEEEVSIANAMGVGIQPYEKKEFFSRRNILSSEFMGPKFHIPLDDPEYGSLGSGPHDIRHRYITEDVPVGCSVYHWLGEKFGVKTPTIDAMINIANAILDVDYYKEGYSLEYLGLGDMNKEEMIAYLNEGVIK